MALHCERCGQKNAHEARFCRHCGAPLTSLPTDPTLTADPLLGQHVLGRYEITALIGEGGMGRVYAAAQRVGTTTRKVAVKTLLPQLGADPQLVKRFYREAETIVRLTHPNTIQFFDFGELPDRTLVIVMEYIEGRTLADTLLNGPISAARFDGILTQICGALFEAHQLGIVHRDLKPDNILLTQRGGQTDFVKVLDFGIAKISSAEDDKAQATKLTQQGMMVGTPPYMSPEQFSGEAVDARSDIYSLGVIAYEMLTGRLPFIAKTPWEWASKHMTAEPEPLRVDAQTGISERRAWAIGRALSKSASERQRDVQEFLSDLTGTGAWASTASKLSAASLPSTVPAATPIHTPRANPDADEVMHRPPQRSRSHWIWIGGMLSVLVLVSGALWWMGGKQPSQVPVLAATVMPSPIPVQPPPDPVAAKSTGVDEVRRTAEPDGEVSATGVNPRRVAERSGGRLHADRGSRVQSPARPSRTTSVEPLPSAPPPQVAPTPTVGASAPLAVPTAPTPASSAATGASVAPILASGSGLRNAEVPKDLADRVQRGLAMASEKPEVAIGMYQAAASKYGADHLALAPLKRALSTRGPARVRELVVAGRCAQAQALFRALRSTGLAPAPAALFGRTCPAPN